MRVFRGIDELRGAVGTHLGHSGWLLVDQERVNRFAEATGDNQWIHVDIERASAGPYGCTIAHGYLTLSLLPRLSWDVFRIEGLRMEINYGLNRVRFPAPVPVGSRLRGGVRLTSLEPAGDGYRLTTVTTVESADGDKPVCVAESLSHLVPA